MKKYIISLVNMLIVFSLNIDLSGISVRMGFKTSARVDFKEYCLLAFFLNYSISEFSEYQNGVLDQNRFFGFCISSKIYIYIYRYRNVRLFLILIFFCLHFKPGDRINNRVRLHGTY